MHLVHLTILPGYPKILAIPQRHHIKIYEADQKFLVEFLPNNEERPRILCFEKMVIFLDDRYVPRNKDSWIKIINEEDSPLDLVVEFYIP